MTSINDLLRKSGADTRYVGVVTPDKYGAKPDARTVIDAAVTAGSTVLTSSTGAFTAADVGKKIVVTSAGAAAPSTTLSSALSTSAAITALPVAALTAAVPAGVVTVRSGSNVQSFTTSGAASGATSIPVNSITPNFAYPSGAAVTGVAAPLKTTIASCQSVTQITLGSAAVATVSGVAACLGTDNYTAITSALSEASSTGKPLYIPDSTGIGEGYLYDGTLTVGSGVRAIRGAGVEDLWSSVGNVDTFATTDTAPWLKGSVLICAALNTHAINITRTGRATNLDDFGIRFAAYHQSTGDGIHTTPAAYNSASDHGLFMSRWNNVRVHGHDGNHYAFNIVNPIGMGLRDLRSYGGGAIRFYNDSSSYYYGNSIVDNLYGAVIAGGTAHGINLDGSGNAIQLIEWHRPQIWTWGAKRDVPNPTTGDQSNIFAVLNRARRMTFHFPDFESNTGCLIQPPSDNSPIYNYSQDYLSYTAAYLAAVGPSTTWNSGDIWHWADEDTVIYSASFTATPDGTNPSTIKVEVSGASDMSNATTLINETAAPASPAGSYPKTYSWVIRGGNYCRVTTSRMSYNRSYFNAARCNLR